MKMGDVFIILCTIVHLTSQKIFACPTCTARVSEQTPPFFAQEFNQSADVNQNNQPTDEQENV